MHLLYWRTDCERKLFSIILQQTSKNNHHERIGNICIYHKNAVPLPRILKMKIMTQEDAIMMKAWTILKHFMLQKNALYTLPIKHKKLHTSFFPRTFHPLNAKMQKWENEKMRKCENVKMWKWVSRASYTMYIPSGMFFCFQENKICQFYPL